MAVTQDAAAVAGRLLDRLAQRDADIFDRVVRVDLEVAFGVDLEIDQPVPRHLVQHVVEKRQAGRQLGRA